MWKIFKVKSADNITDLNNIPIPCIYMFKLVSNLNIYRVAERRVFWIILFFYIKLAAIEQASEYL